MYLDLKKSNLIIFIILSFAIHCFASYFSVGFYSQDEHFQILSPVEFLLGINDNLYELSNTHLPSLSPIPPPGQYETQLEQLRNMGFHDTIRNLDVLQLVGGDIEMALVYLTDS